MFWPIRSLKIGGGVGEFKVQLCLQNDRLFEIVKWLNMNMIPSRFNYLIQIIENSKFNYVCASSCDHPG
jgi:hypothetical protein